MEPAQVFSAADLQLKRTVLATRGSKLFLVIRSAASISQLLHEISVPVGAWYVRLELATAIGRPFCELV